jgi:glucose/mannose-6-phosphate isomerase
MQAEIQDAIKKYDTHNVFESMTLFPDQCKAAWNTNPVSTKNKDIKNILIMGMGGSALGGYMLASLNSTKVPMIVSNDYTIPTWVNEDTLVLAMSYSGNTEETLSGFGKAIESGATIVSVTTGGTLAEISKEHNIPVHVIDRTRNPCEQPRFGVGAMMMEMLKIFGIFNVCTVSDKDVNDALSELQAWAENFKNTDQIENIYREAEAIKDKMPVLIHSEHLANVGRFMRNQINETGKTFAVAHELPELNHHLLEGLEFPKSNKKELYVMFFESDLFSAKIQKRIAVTKDVLEKQEIGFASFHVDGTTPLSQILICMLRDMYTAYMLGIIHQKNPNDINWVNYFKKNLA